MLALRAGHRVVRGGGLLGYSQPRVPAGVWTKLQPAAQPTFSWLLPPYRDRWSRLRLSTRVDTPRKWEKVIQSWSLSTRCLSVRGLMKEELGMVEKYMERLERCVKQSAIQTSQRLSFKENLMGINPKLKNGSMGSASLNAFLLGIKKKFPEEVLLCRVPSLTCA